VSPQYPGSGGRVLLGILGGGTKPGSPNLDPISDRKMSFSDRASKIHTYSQTWPLRNYVIIV